MIIDSLKNAAIYESLSPLLCRGFAYLRSFDPATHDGRIPIAGDDLFALVQTVHPDPPERRQFEAHRNYLDIQWVFQGTETIYVADVQSLIPATEYDVKRDIFFLEDPPMSSKAVLRPGDFALLLPQDAHKPCCIADGTDLIRKAVLKVRVAACQFERLQTSGRAPVELKGSS